LATRSAFLLWRKYKENTVKAGNSAENEIRILGRTLGEELTVAELEQVVGGELQANKPKDPILGTNTDTGTQCDR
jgi:hypothetical protein